MLLICSPDVSSVLGVLRDGRYPGNPTNLLFGLLIGLGYQHYIMRSVVGYIIFYRICSVFATKSRDLLYRVYKDQCM